MARCGYNLRVQKTLPGALAAWCSRIITTHRATSLRNTVLMVVVLVLLAASAGTIAGGVCVQLLSSVDYLLTECRAACCVACSHRTRLPSPSFTQSLARRLWHASAYSIQHTTPQQYHQNIMQPMPYVYQKHPGSNPSIRTTK